MISGIFKKRLSELFRNIPIYYAGLFFLLVVFVLDYAPGGEHQFSFLAESFLKGKLYFLSQPGSWHDAVFFSGNYYWPLGPFPAVLLMPFVYVFDLMGRFFYQGYLQFFLVIMVFMGCFKISRRISYSKSDSIYLAYAFCFSSVFLGVALVPSGWQFAQVVATLLLFLSILEFFGKKRYWLLGIIMGLVAATRATAGLGIILFALEIILSKKHLKIKAKDMLRLSIPFGLAIAGLLLYDYFRFGNIFEQGYAYQLLNGELEKARSYGMFSFSHFLSNIYYSFLSMPSPVFKDSTSVLIYPFIQANPWGMSIFLTSPYLLTVFFLKNNDKLSKILLIAIFFIAFPIMMYYGIGWYQFGYRYALDFMPFLFLLFMLNYHKENKVLSWKIKVVILLSSFLNLHLFFTIFHG
ncbi:MAG: hypothetical protein HGB08_00085 [Candidatus Moranbacteria bacterium]|nr:hypothetical protein [Candidatus Moranbacteria bacterium]